MTDPASQKSPPATSQSAPKAAPKSAPAPSPARAKKKTAIKTRASLETLALRTNLETQRKADAKSMLKDNRWWKISVLRRSGKVNPELWDFRSKADLDRVKKEWSYLGITTGNSAYYNAIFRQLGKSHDRQFLGTITRPSLKYDAYTNPFQNLKDLEANTDPDFSHAVRFFASIKKRVADQDSLQKATTEGLQKKNEDSIVSEAGRIVRENLSAFSEAIKTRDYSTAAIYFLGIYAAYRTYKSLPKDKQDRYGKYFFWGATAYCGNIFLKKAGIDVLKKLGFKDADAEVRGTPMAVLSRLDLDLKPEDYVTAKSVNYTNFSSLYEKYKKTNKPGGIRWIDPNQFPTAFGDRFRGMRSSDITKTKGLSAKQKAYKAKGESLYRVVQALERAYNKTMRRHTDKSLTAVLSGGILAKSTVFDFALGLLPYAPEHRLEKGIIASLKGLEKAKTRLREVFKNSGMGFSIEKGKKAGHYDGRLMGFPVVFVRDTRNGRFLVFAKSDYDAANKSPHVTMALGSVPYKGGASTNVKTLQSVLYAKMMDKHTGLLSRFPNTAKGPITFKNVKYKHPGGWRGEITYNRGNLIPGNGPVSTKVSIIIGDDGRSLSLNRISGGTLAYIKDVLDAEKFYGNIVLSKLVTQRATGKVTDFSVLRWFNMGNKLSFHDNDPSDDKFRISIGRVPFDVWIRLNGTTGKYEFVNPAMEKKLLGNYIFKRELREVVGKNKELERAVNELTAMVKSTPERYFLHLVENIPSWFTKATWDRWFRGVQLSHFTGSVAKNYTYALIDAQKEKILTDFEVALNNGKSFSEIGDIVNKTLPVAIQRFNDLTEKLSKLRGRHEAEGADFSEAEYSETILVDLMAIGCKSEDYKGWYRRFASTLLVGGSIDDLRKGKASRVKQLMKVFSYYTAPIDDPSIDGAKLWAKKPKKGDPDYNKKLVKWQKAEKHRRHAAYADYVMTRIHLKMKTLRQGQATYPGPSSRWWGIVPFDSWDYTKATSGHEFIDTRKPWRMKYHTFGEYLASLNTSSPIKEDDVILPRETKTYKLPTDPNKKRKALVLLRKLTGTKANMETMRLSELESHFFKKLKQAILELQKKFGEKAKPLMFTRLLADYRMMYEMNIPPARDSVIVKFGHEDGSTPPKFIQGSTAMNAAMSYLRSQLPNLSATTVTRTQQEHAINMAVLHTLKWRILDSNQIGKYVQKGGPARWIRDKWRDFKDWLFGLRN